MANTENTSSEGMKGTHGTDIIDISHTPSVELLQISSKASDMISSVRSSLGISTSGLSAMTSDDFSILRDISPMTIMMKIPALKRDLPGIGIHLGMGIQDESIRNRALDHAAVVGLAAVLWGVGGNAVMLHDFLQSDNPQDFMLDNIKRLAPDFSDTLSMLETMMSVTR